MKSERMKEIEEGVNTAQVECLNWVLQDDIYTAHKKAKEKLDLMKSETGIEDVYKKTKKVPPYIIGLMRGYYEFSNDMNEIATEISNGSKSGE